MRIAVIGAGITGLTVTRLLPPHLPPHTSLTLFDKSSRLSGRCGTLTRPPTIIDHGAAYFTLGDDRVRGLLEKWGMMGGLENIGVGDIVDENGDVVEERGGLERVYWREGMRRMGEEILRGVEREVDVRRDVKVEEVRRGVDGMWMVDGTGFDCVVCCVPLVQVENLVDGEVWEDIVGGIGKRKWEGCLTGVFGFDGSGGMKDWCGNKFGIVGEGDLRWSYRESWKQGRVFDDRIVIIGQGSAMFSEKYMEEDVKVWLGILRGLVEKAWGIEPGKCQAAFGKRWRYARVAGSGEMKTKDGKDAVYEVDPGFLLCGDGVTGVSKVESAFLSGICGAKRVQSFFTP